MHTISHIGDMMKKTINIRWQLLMYDAVILAAVDYALLFVSGFDLTVKGALIHVLLSFVCVFSVRIACNIYGQIWRYGGIQCYIRLLMADAGAFILGFVIERALPLPSGTHIAFNRLLAVYCMNLLCALAIRMVYRYAFKCGDRTTRRGKMLSFLLKVFAGSRIVADSIDNGDKIKIAIIGAGRVGVSFAEELLNNKASAYYPCCFIDTNHDKAGRSIHNINVLYEDADILEKLDNLQIKEVIFAVSSMKDTRRKELYEFYKNAGYKVRVYDYPAVQTVGGKRQIRDFDIEELLFRKPIVVNSEKNVAFYRGKVVLVTGGGGSIGSELCRQIAKMEPKQLIILDICENGAYDVEQELKIAYKCKLDIKVEILSITNRRAMEKIFLTYHPQVVVNAAAHKHVPLMEHNCVEAVENNVFGTKVVIDLCEKYGTECFIMVSTDKAVNPTNVMGATKRMCEMLVLNASLKGTTKYSITRFGNVLGSAGSVIPLFKKQIMNGGPITVTDRRIIRYFMTIPEATQLVLTSGAMAHNGEIFVFDMGQPVRIYDLAENMIQLLGVHGIEIIETGLRPGEKLYEELLVKTEKLDKTENNLIFIEKDTVPSNEEISDKLTKLFNACETEDDDKVRQALIEVVPTYHLPEDINATADESDEMKSTAVCNASLIIS